MNKGEGHGQPTPKATSPKAAFASLDDAMSAAVEHQQAGRLDEAVEIYHWILDHRPDDEFVLHLMGIASAQGGDPEAAVELIEKAIDRNSGIAAFHINLGNFLGQLGRLDEAATAQRRALEMEPDNAQAHNNLGTVLRSQGMLDQAADCYRRALSIEPDDAELHFNFGNVHRDQENASEAIGCYRRAIELRPGYADAWNNLGLTQQTLGHWDDAAASYHQALAARPDHVDALNNLGTALQAMGDFEGAMKAYQQVISVVPDYAKAHFNMGSIQQETDDPEGAVASLEKALELDPDDPDAFASLFDVRESVCDWRDRDTTFRRLVALTERQIAAGIKTAMNPFRALARPLQPAMQLALARTWSAGIERHMEASRNTLAYSFQGRDHDRLRVGYLSNDLGYQPMTDLIQGLPGLHDRGKFEIFIYSFHQDDGSTYRKRIEAESEHFIDILIMSHGESAQRIFDDEIDVLVDLKGFTQNTRLEILALRPAPVQVGYIGFPGTTGAEFLDYILTDEIVTPREMAPHYSEKLVFLPDCYLMTDDGQATPEPRFTRAECGLPEDAFVFCCFNAPYKIEPGIFDAWMRILSQVPNGVLWLYRGHPLGEANLKREAEARGIAGDRLVFAGKMPKDDHLARHGCADLFLDTFYYTAHTTAVDALWMGLPVLTCPGEHFVSRVSASLLRAIGMPEMIMANLDDYERRAVRLATDPRDLRGLGDKLMANRRTRPLFDSPAITRNLERAYQGMWEIFQAGDPARSFAVRAGG